MAKVEISKWEIAKMFGLTFIGEEEANSVEEGYGWQYSFKINSQEIVVQHGMGDDEAYDDEEAKEIAADVSVEGACEAHRTAECSWGHSMMYILIAVLCALVILSNNGSGPTA